MPIGETSGVRIEVQAPRQFDLRRIVIVNAYGLVLVFPVLVSVLALSSLPFGLVPALLPFVAIIGGAFFLPFGFGNPCIRRLFSPASQKPDEFLVQVTFSPRLVSGMRALLEDADDVGILRFTPSAIVFEGDSVRLEIPPSEVAEFYTRGIGIRGLFLYGQRLTLRLKPNHRPQLVDFAERSSSILLTSWRVTRELKTRFERALARP